MPNHIHTCPSCGEEKEIVVSGNENIDEIGCHCSYPTPEEYYLSPASLLKNLNKEENPNKQ